MNDLTALGERIASLRAGRSQQHLANAAQVDVTTVSRLERGKLDPSFSTLDRIRTALGVSWEDLMGPSGNRIDVNLRVHDHVLLSLAIKPVEGNDQSQALAETERFVKWAHAYAGARAAGAPTPRGVTPPETVRVGARRSGEDHLLADAVQLLTDRVEELDEQIQELRRDRALLADARREAHG